MLITYSIAEARDQFTSLIHQVEEGDKSIKVTRRGEPVAVILSVEAYERLLARLPRHDFWQAYLEWRKMWHVDGWDDESDPFAGVRDRSPGREVNIWD